MPTGMEELRRWSPLLICIVPRPRLVHTPKRVAITLNEEEKVNFKSVVKGSQVYLSISTRSPGQPKMRSPMRG